MSLKTILGEPYKSVEEATKAKRAALIGLCAVVAVQAAAVLFFWWINTQSDSLSPLIAWPNFDGVLLFSAAIILYFTNSRIFAGLLLALAALELTVTWVLKATTTESLSPPGMALVLAVVAVQLVIAVFKTHNWQSVNNAKAPRSKWVMGALMVTSILMLTGFLVPPVHFWNHTRNAITLTGNAETLRYYEPLDKYSFEFPKAWKIEHPPLEYGNVILHSDDGKDVSVSVERWSPWSIAPIVLFNKEAFLKMAQDEAEAYSAENQLTVESVEMVGPTNVNEARVEYTGLDGSKTYVYYLYDRAWSRQTSDAAHFFWRITAVVPKGAEQDDVAV